MQLDASFEADLRESVLDGAQEQIEDELAQEAIDASHDRLQEVAARNDYEVEPVIDTLDGPHVERQGDTIVVYWEWTHEAAIFFDQGTVDHTVEGNPVLAFDYPVADGGPGGTVFSAGHEVSGIEQSRFARAGVEHFRRRLEGIDGS